MITVKISLSEQAACSGVIQLDASRQIRKYINV